MQTIRTHNAYHLGDNLVHLHFLRKVALANPDRQFVHYAQNQYNWQLRPVIEDAPNLKLDDYGYTLPSDSINSWRGDKQIWYKSPTRNDFVEFHLKEWFPYLSDRIGVDNPMRTSADMLFDYPAIQIRPKVFNPPFDVLIINSPPGSGQFERYNEDSLTDLALKLLAQGLSVIRSGTGKPIPFFTATEVGHLSLHCHTILMVSSGPSWPTWNVWNQDSVKTRVVLLDNERVNLAPNSFHCERIEEAEEVLKCQGLL